MPKFHTVYDPPLSRGVDFIKSSLVEQSHAPKMDINKMISRATRTGVLASESEIRSVYFGDFTKIGDSLQTHLQICEAQERFDALPSRVRDHFDNNPLKFLRAVGDPDCIPQLVKLGLVKSDPVATEAEPIQVLNPVSSELAEQ